MSRCFAETRSATTTAKTKTKTALSRVDGVVGEAECATTQIVHCASSLKLECWCTAKPYADTNITRMQRAASGFNTDRIRSFPTENSGLNLQRNRDQLQEFAGEGRCNSTSPKFSVGLLPIPNCCYQSKKHAPSVRLFLGQ